MSRGKNESAAQSCTDLLSSHYEAKQRKIGITKLKFIIKANEAVFELLGSTEAMIAVLL